MGSGNRDSYTMLIKAERRKTAHSRGGMYLS